MPGHAESIAAAGDIDVDKIGLSIIGIGNAANRPQVTLGTVDTVDIDIDAASCTIENIDFIAAIDDIVAAVDVNAAGFAMRNCRFLEPTTDKNFKIAILGAAANGSPRLTVEGCRFESVDASNTAAISLPGTSDGCVIRDNFIYGVYEDSAILAAGAITRCEVTSNLIHQLDTEADSCISIAATSTGFVAYNAVGSAVAGNATTNINCGSHMTMCENYSVDWVAGDVQGVLDPVATT